MSLLMLAVVVLFAPALLGLLLLTSSLEGRFLRDPDGRRQLKRGHRTAPVQPGAGHDFPHDRVA